jgi:hypothetical protein
MAFTIKEIEALEKVFDKDDVITVEGKDVSVEIAVIYPSDTTPPVLEFSFQLLSSKDDLWSYEEMVKWNNPFATLSAIFDKGVEMLENAREEGWKYPVGFDSHGKRVAVYRRLLKKRGMTVEDAGGGQYIIC